MTKPRLWVVTSPGGHRTNVTSFIGTDRYEQVCAVLRRGGELDSTEADTQHQRLVVARGRWDAAYQVWFAAGAPTGGHPGSLSDYMPEEA